MSKCPHCGEPVRLGQASCFACGQRLVLRGARGRRQPANPVVFLVAGAAVVIAAVGMLLLVPRQSRSRQAEAEQAELRRVQDSVRRTNIEQRSATQQDREMTRLNDELARLELRLTEVKGQVIGAKPTEEQRRLVGEISQGLARYRQMVAGMPQAREEGRRAIADSVRQGERRLRNLISELTRAPKQR